jgi:prefoldin subunit 5
MMEQGVQTMGTVSQLVRFQTQILETVSKSNTEIRNAIAVMHARSLASNELTYICGDVSRLLSDVGNKELMLMIADTDAKRVFIERQIEQAQEELKEQKERLRKAEKKVESSMRSPTQSFPKLTTMKKTKLAPPSELARFAWILWYANFRYRRH